MGRLEGETSNEAEMVSPVLILRSTSERKVQCPHDTNDCGQNCHSLEIDDGSNLFPGSLCRIFNQLTFRFKLYLPFMEGASVALFVH